MDTQETREKLAKAYHTMLERVKDFWHEQQPGLKENLDKAMEKASELGELTREEAIEVGQYLKKDLEQAADYLSETGKEFKDWVQNDLEYAETRFAEMFANMADKTRVELDKLAERARQVGVWHTGEITGVGILYCQQCGEALHFEKPGHVPPCPKCNGTIYKKVFTPTQD